MKRVLGCVLSIVMLISMLSIVGCEKAKQPVDTSAETSAETSGTTAAPAEEVTLRVFTRWSDASPASAAFRDRMAEFMKQNPAITIDDMSTNDEATFNDKWKASVATGDIPDVFQNYGGVTNADYVKNKLFADLGGDLDADKQWKEGFLDFFGNWQYEGVQGIYGVPYEFYAVALFYNKDLLQKVNAEAPKTVKEFEEVSEKLKAAGIVPMAVGAKDKFKGAHLFSCLALKKHGTQLFPDIAGGKVKWDGAEVADIFTIMSDWNVKGYLGSNNVGVDYNAEKAMFFDEKTAMHYDGSWFLSEAEASTIKDKIGVVAFPGFDEKPEYKDTWMGGAGAGLSVSGALTGAKREAAVKFLKFVTSIEHFRAVQQASKGGVYPVKLEADPATTGPVTVAYSAAVKTAKQFSVEAGAFVKPEVSAQIGDSIQGMFAGNSSEKAAKEIAAKVK